jgi:RNA polymerase sigma-70 factor (ECF subfamily)
MGGSSLKDRLLSQRRILAAYALGLAGEPTAARDLVHECMLRALSASRIPDDDAAFRAWLLRIMRNFHIDQLRKSARIDYVDPEDLEDIEEYHGGEDRFLDRLSVRLAFGRLAPLHREILTLVDILGLSYAEAAKVLDVPVGTVMSRVSRAREVMLAMISDTNVVQLRTKRRERG